VAIKGVVHCGTVAIRNAQVAVVSTGYLPEGVPPITGSVTTGLDGSFVYTVPPGPDREVSFGYTSYSDDPGPSVTATATRRIPFEDDAPTTAFTARQGRYWLMLVLCALAVDNDTLKPIGQATPVPPNPQYPPGFLARYCWW